MPWSKSTECQEHRLWDQMSRMGWMLLEWQCVVVDRGVRLESILLLVHGMNPVSLAENIPSESCILKGPGWSAEMFGEMRQTGSDRWLSVSSREFIAPDSMSPKSPQVTLPLNTGNLKAVSWDLPNKLVQGHSNASFQDNHAKVSMMG